MRPLLVGLAAGLLAAGCGAPATVELQLAATAPPEGVRAILIGLAGVEAHAKVKKPKAAKGQKKDKAAKQRGEGSRRKGHWVAVDGAPGEIDLAALRDDARATLGTLSLPEGKITQIRLHPDPAGRNEVHLEDGSVCPLDLSSIGPKGIKINHPFKAIEVRAGETREIVIVIDLRQSLEGEGCAFRLAPVIKIRPAAEADEGGEG